MTGGPAVKDRVHEWSTAHGRLGLQNSVRGVKGVLAWLMWQPRSCHVSTRADVALRWHHGGGHVVVPRRRSPTAARAHMAPANGGPVSSEEGTSG